MRLSRFLPILIKDLRRGPRTSMFLLVVVYPFLMTGIVELVFGSFLDDTPRVGVVAGDDSAAVRSLQDAAGIEVTTVGDADELWRLVEAHDFDVGWVVPAGFDAAVQRGEKPLLNVRICGDSYADVRLILMAAIADAVRSAAGAPSPVEISTTRLGDKPPLPIKDRLLPMLILLSVMLGGAFLPASSLVDEREKRTLSALLVTPVSMGDVLAAKGLLGFMMAFFCVLVTLGINGAINAASLPLMLVLVVSAVMFVELGIVLGCVSKDVNMMMTIWKGTAWLFMMPVVPYLWDAFPLWLAMASPTYYIITPVWELVMEGASMADVAWKLGVAVALCVALLVPVRWAARRAERLAAG